MSDRRLKDSELEGCSCKYRKYDFILKIILIAMLGFYIFNELSK